MIGILILKIRINNKLIIFVNNMKYGRKLEKEFVVIINLNLKAI